MVEGNHEKVSPGGKLIKELIETGKYVLANASDKTVGGPFTRYTPNCIGDPVKSSCLDLCIISRDLEKYLDVMVIDKELKFTPGYSNGSEIKYTDHYSLFISFKGIPLKSNKKSIMKRESTWNTRKKVGWEKYFKKTEFNRKFRQICSNIEDLSPDKADKQFQTELKKCKICSIWHG